MSDHPRRMTAPAGPHPEPTRPEGVLMSATYDEVMISLGLEPSTSKQAKCGTPSGHNRHRRRGEKPCQDCADARAAYQRERRAAPKDVGQMPPIDHGTAHGARQHWYRNEPPCDACRDAYNTACRPMKRADARRRRAARSAPAGLHRLTPAA